MADEDASLPLSPGEQSLSAGQLILDRYRLTRMLGRGGFGVVWLAFDEGLHMNVAIKFLSDFLTSDDEAISDLKRETRNSLRLTHPNIMRIHGFLQGGGLAGISMEFVDGDTLSSMKVRRPGRCFSTGDLEVITTDLCRALDYAHGRAQIVHRDLKPANLMTTGEGELKIADFGISRCITDTRTRLSGQGGGVGTLPYMSPQQMSGDSPSTLDDVYSLGATLYDLLAGKPPFYTGDLVHQVLNVEPTPIPDRRAELQITDLEPVPEAWQAVIMACLAKEREDRPDSARTVARMLGLDTPSASGFDSIPASAPLLPDSGEATTADTVLVERAETEFATSRGGHALPKVAGGVVVAALAAAGVYFSGVLGPSPRPELKPSRLNFGTVELGGANEQTFAITNAGGKTLAGTVPAVCDDFKVTAGAGPFALSGDESHIVTVRFEPATAGDAACNVDLGLDASTVALSGVGLAPVAEKKPEDPKPQPPPPGEAEVRTPPAVVEAAPRAALSPSRLDFGSVDAGSDGRVMSFTLVNQGGGRLTGRIASTCASFIVESGGGLFDLGANESKSVAIRFRPESAGGLECAIETGGGPSLICRGTGRAVIVEPPPEEEPEAPAPVIVADDVLIRQVIQNYEKTMGSLDVDGYLKLWTSAARPSRSDIEERFGQFRSQSVRMEVLDVKTEGEASTVHFRAESSFLPASGSRQNITQTGVMTLVRTAGNEWRISELQFQR